MSGDLLDSKYLVVAGKIFQAVRFSSTGLSGWLHAKLVPFEPSLTIPRCFAYQARSAPGFADLKNTPPIPRTRAMSFSPFHSELYSTPLPINRAVICKA